LEFIRYLEDTSKLLWGGRQMNTVENVLALAVVAMSWDEQAQDHLFSEIKRPDWPVGNDEPTGWMQFVPLEVRDLWPRLSAEAKLTAHLVAASRAGRTGWVDGGTVATP
jgi:hypothetical protein